MSLAAQALAQARTARSTSLSAALAGTAGAGAGAVVAGVAGGAAGTGAAGAGGATAAAGLAGTGGAAGGWTVTGPEDWLLGACFWPLTSAVKRVRINASLGGTALLP